MPQNAPQAEQAVRAGNNNVMNVWERPLCSFLPHDAQIHLGTSQRSFQEKLAFQGKAQLFAYFPVNHKHYRTAEFIPSSVTLLPCPKEDQEGQHQTHLLLSFFFFFLIASHTKRLEGWICGWIQGKQMGIVTQVRCPPSSSSF